MPRDPHLLSYRGGDRLHQEQEPRLDPRVGEEGCRGRELSRRLAAPPDAGEDSGIYFAGAQRRLPDRKRVAQGNAARDVEEDVDDSVTEFAVAHGRRAASPVDPHASRVEARCRRRHRDMEMVVRRGPQAEALRLGEARESPAEFSGSPQRGVAPGCREPTRPHTFHRALCDGPTYAVGGEPGLAGIAGTYDAVVRGHVGTEFVHGSHQNRVDPSDALFDGQRGSGRDDRLGRAWGGEPLLRRFAGEIRWEGRIAGETSCWADFSCEADAATRPLRAVQPNSAAASS